MTVGFILHIANVVVGKMPHPRVLCNLGSTISLIFNSIIIQHLALISVERFIAVKFALRYHTIVTNRRAVLASIVIWLWGIAVASVSPVAMKIDGLETFEEFFKPWHRAPIVVMSRTVYSQHLSEVTLFSW
ncbi:Adrenoceptor alpha 1D [Desmophyllum pertusum]|uniref:Adrenoceptor alpha 1D n=1 Tax=Desmophyllum pertusum TaxID=174260 RepID=A0A9W9Z3Q1_9CNID|nr:Adrenoceptor alpha 1D [Desmophyllum pertusum]